MVTIKLRIGRSMLEMQANNEKDIHKFCAIYGALPNVCDNCQSDDIYLSHKSPKGNDYYTLVCKKCNASMRIHQKKEDKGFYVVAEEKMVIYQPTPEGFDDAVKEEEKKNDAAVMQRAEEVSSQEKDGIPY